MPLVRFCPLVLIVLTDDSKAKKQKVSQTTKTTISPPKFSPFSLLNICEQETEILTCFNELQKIMKEIEELLTEQEMFPQSSEIPYENISAAKKIFEINKLHKHLSSYFENKTQENVPEAPISQQDPDILKYFDSLSINYCWLMSNKTRSEHCHLINALEHVLLPGNEEYLNDAINYFTDTQMKICLLPFKTDIEQWSVETKREFLTYLKTFLVLYNQ